MTTTDIRYFVLMGDGRITDETIDRLLASVAPVTLPMAAWGSRELERYEPPRPVWAWVSWPNRAAERHPALAIAGNDRIVVLSVQIGLTSRWEPVVWRNAVTRRAPTDSLPSAHD